MGTRHEHITVDLNYVALCITMK